MSKPETEAVRMTLDADECPECGCPDWENRYDGPACSACGEPWPLRVVEPDTEADA